MNAETGEATYAFLLTDIEGSTVLWERHQAAMPAAIARHDELLHHAIATAGGRVFKTTGDGMFAVFSTATAAIQAALAAQAALTAETFAAGTFTAIGGAKIRMAVHAGPATPRAGDYFGPALNRAARLLAAAHGGQVLISAAAAAAPLPPGATLLDLGSHRLKDFPRPETIHQLIAPALPAAFPPLASLESHPHNLPVQVTSFIGRDAETETIIETLARHRLVTLVGPGGAGKTRLALRVGEQILDRAPDGEWLVELAPLTADTQVPEALAALLGLTLQGANPALAVAQYLKPRRMLIILDNCEHLIAGAANLADALLKHAPGIAILATSRERLSVDGEAIIPLAALATPEPNATLTPATAATYPAIRLFIERAALTSFTPTLADLPAIAEICRRLDGLPLAIELAAARTRMLRPAELLARLQNRFELLSAGTRTAQRRQQTLKTLIDWSVDLLSEPEKTLFRRLAVFGGSFSLDFATRIAAASPLDPADIFELLSALVDKSIVTPVAGGAGGSSRYRLLESMRAYGRDALTRSGEAETIHRRFADEMLAFVTAGERSWSTSKPAAWRPLHTPEIDNLRAALEWAFSPAGDPEGGDPARGDPARGDPERGLALIARSAQIWPEAALTMERYRWAALAATRISPATNPEIDARIALILAGWGPPDKTQRQHAAIRAKTLFRTLGDPENTAFAAAVLANLLVDPADMTACKTAAAEAAAILPALPAGKRQAMTLNQLASVAAGDGDLARATSLTAQAYDIAQAFEDSNALETYGINLAEWLFQTGDYAGAIEKAEAVAASSRRGRDTLRRAYAVSNLLAYHLVTDNLEAARAAAREALPLHLANEDDYGLAVTIEHTALLAARSGHPSLAARLAGFSDAYHRTNNITRIGTERAIHTALTAATQPDPAGAGWTNAEAVDAALSALLQSPAPPTTAALADWRFISG